MKRNIRTRQMDIARHIAYCHSYAAGLSRPTELFTLDELAAQGIFRGRQPSWVNPFDHIEIAIADGKVAGLWVKLWSPFNKESNGRDPVDICLLSRVVDRDAKGFIPYEGPLPEDPEYKAEVRKFDGVLDPTPTYLGAGI